MEALTPAERRGALVVAALFGLGAVYDLWRSAGSDAPGREIARDSAWPTAAVSPRPSPAAAGTPPSVRAGRPLDLNRASAQELEGLPGIGPVLAARVVAYRERHGPFRRVEELLGVRGIGPRLFARLRDRFVVPAPGP